MSIPQNNFKRIRFLLHVLTSSAGVMSLYSPLLIILTLAGVAAPFAMGRLIDALANRQSFVRPFVLLAGLLLFKTLLSPILQRFILKRARAIETDLQFRVLESLMNLSPGQLDSAGNGERIAKLTRDAYAVGSFVRGLYPQLLQAMVMMLATGFALCSRSTTLCISFLIFFPLVLALFAPFARQFADNTHCVRKQSDGSFNALFNFLLALPFLRTLDAEHRFADTPRTALHALKGGNDTTDALCVRFGFLLNSLLIGGEVAVLGIAGSLAANGTIPVGDVVLYQMLFISAIQSIQGVVALLPELTTLREGADSLNEALAHPAPNCGKKRLAALESLAFDHVTFAYPSSSDRPVISDFSATLRPGTVVRFVGENGAGKSTLLKLAVGALEAQSGEIRVNGHPLSSLDLAAFRRRIGIVFQDNPLVDATIRDNITLRDPSFTAQDIENALNSSGFDAVVRRLPDGLDTLVGNGSRNLSGGERQRLAIARAIIRNPFILVLDEATNHLDVASRKTFADLVARLRPGRLILLAGHDTETDRICDLRISCQISEKRSYIEV